MAGHNHSLRSSEVSVNDSLLIIVPKLGHPPSDWQIAGLPMPYRFQSKGEAKQAYTLELTPAHSQYLGPKMQSLLCNEEAWQPSIYDKLLINMIMTSNMLCKGAE